MEIKFHPKVLEMLTTMAEQDFDVYEDVLMLINALGPCVSALDETSWIVIRFQGVIGIPCFDVAKCC